MKDAVTELDHTTLTIQQEVCDSLSQVLITPESEQNSPHYGAIFDNAAELLLGAADVELALGLPDEVKESAIAIIQRRIRNSEISHYIAGRCIQLINGKVESIGDQHGQLEIAI